MDQLLVPKRSYDIVERLVANLVRKDFVYLYKEICTPSFREQVAGSLASTDEEDICEVLIK